MAMEFLRRLPLPKAQLSYPGVRSGDNTSAFCSPLWPNEPPKLLAAIRAGAYGEQNLCEGVQQLLGPKHGRPG